MINTEKLQYINGMIEILYILSIFISIKFSVVIILSLMIAIVEIVVNLKIAGCSLYWEKINGEVYWYENGQRQGIDFVHKNYRGKEIYDPGSGAWYWLDNIDAGKKAVSKDVYQESRAGV